MHRVWSKIPSGNTFSEVGCRARGGTHIGKGYGDVPRS